MDRSRISYCEFVTIRTLAFLYLIINCGISAYYFISNHYMYNDSAFKQLYVSMIVLSVFKIVSALFASHFLTNSYNINNYYRQDWNNKYIIILYFLYFADVICSITLLIFGYAEKDYTQFGNYCFNQNASPSYITKPESWICPYFETSELLNNKFTYVFIHIQFAYLYFGLLYMIYKLFHCIIIAIMPCRIKLSYNVQNNSHTEGLIDSHV